MNNIIISPLAADPNKQQPFTSPSLTFLQNATLEALKNSLINTIGSIYSTSTAYVLEGCVNSGSGSNYVISAGAIFYNGEIFTVPSATFTSAGGQTAVGKIVITNPSPDPILLKDGTSTSVHNVRQIVFASAVSGTGISDFANLYYSSKISASANLASPVVGFSTITTFVTLTPSSTQNTNRLQINFSGYCQVSASGANSLKVYVYNGVTLLKTLWLSIATGGYGSFSGNITTSYNAGDVITIQGEVTSYNATMEELNLDCNS